MQQSLRLLLISFSLLTVSVWSQDSFPDQYSYPPLARLSYQRSPMSAERIQQMCISVSQDGKYRMVVTSNYADRPTRLEGKMSGHQLNRLKMLLSARVFRSESGNDGGLIRDHSESFAAEISRIEFTPAFQLEGTDSSGHPRNPPGPPHRLQWLNPDDQRPFPAALEKVIDWMTDFEPENARPLDYSEFSDICPSVGVSFVQPSIAANGHP